MLFLILIMIVVLAAATLGWLTMTKGFLLRTLGVLAVLGFLAVIVAIGALAWKHLVLALAIGSVCALGAGVVLQKLDAAKAITGALVGFILFFGFTWLAVQLADPLFFGQQSELSELLWELFGTLSLGRTPGAGHPLAALKRVLQVATLAVIIAVLAGWKD